MSQIEAARVFGVSRRAVGVWVRAHRISGEAALRPNRRGRAPGDQFALPRPQQARLLRIMADGPPDAAGLDFPVWNRRALAALVDRELGLTLSPVTVGQYLGRWGLVPEAPATRAEVVRHRHPELRGESRGRETLTVTWTRLPSLAGAPFDPDLPRASLEVLAARSGRGAVSFVLGRRPFAAPGVADFGDRLARHVGRGVHLVVCGWPAEHLDVLRGWRAAAPAEPARLVTVS